jgi:group I intron endonuclease
MKLPGIYAIRNVRTGKFYVGSSVDMFRRWSAHRSCLNKGSHKSQKLQRSWNKYGASCFEFSVLQVVRDIAELESIEQVWLDRMDAVDNGYNAMKIVGQIGRLPKSNEHKRAIVAGRAGYKHSEETKEKQRLAARGRKSRPMSEATKQALLAANTGRRMTEESRKKLSDSRRGMKTGPHSEERKSAISLAKVGKPLSEHHKQRIRDGHLARRAALNASKHMASQ